MTGIKAGAAHAVQRCAAVLNAVDDGPAALRAALVRYGEPVDEELTDDQFAALSLSARRLRAIAAEESPDRVCDALNQVLATCHPPRLSAHDGSPWHLHIDSDDVDWGEWFLASSAMAMAITVAETQQPPLGICGASGCANVYPVSSPGRPRSYCSTTCATRARVHAHRART